MSIRNVCILTLSTSILFSCTTAIDRPAIQERVEAQIAKPVEAEITPLPTDQLAIPQDSTATSYILGVEDVIDIIVINNSDLNTAQAIGPDGKISFYPTGEIQAAGLTVEELRQVIIDRLKSDPSIPYRLGIDDVINITVYNHDALESTQTIGPNGKISFYPEGEIQAAGLTVEELRQVIIDRLKSNSSAPYRLGIDDVINITVYNYDELEITQAIGPNGKISFYPEGDIQAAGLSVEELRQVIIDRLKSDPSAPYRLGIDDVINITVYNHDALETTQAVRPDGKISIIAVGDIHAAGKTLDTLREEITKELSSLLTDPIVNIVIVDYRSNPISLANPIVNIDVVDYKSQAVSLANPIVNVIVVDYKSKPISFANPIVNVEIKEYNSKKISILGSVEQPGILRMKSNITLIEGISLMGGLSEDADLKRAMLFRNQNLVPINFYALFKKGAISQNIQLQSQDAIFIPSTADNKIYVIGEVNNPGSISWEGSINLLETIALAGGFTGSAKSSDVLLIRGGLVEPTLRLVDAQSITQKGVLENNLALKTGDIVFVPHTTLSTVATYFEVANKILVPILALQTTYLLLRQIREDQGNTINVIPGT